ncbi:MAG: tRNA (adenosine(37)-N6)-dimethylallyltransferase MiaA [Candidatus Binatia bacterium]
MLPKIVIIVGPTAVGKSDLALDLAVAIDGAIVNADSQQVYRYLDIGTGKPTPAERQRVRHFLIDVIDPDEEFNAARFRFLAIQSIELIRADQKNAIVCGGTGLYLKALAQGLFEGPGQDAEIRRALEQRIKNDGLAPLYRWLTEVDPSGAATIHPNDRQRTIRALEVYRLTGKPMSDWQKEHAFRERQFELLKIGLNRPRDELYDLINRRCARMVEDGLVEEVRGLVTRGYGLALKSLRSVGYRQMGQVLEGRQTLPDALEEMKQETRHLAKRQLTWFRADQEVAWFHPRQKSAVIESVKRFLAS